MKYLLSLLLSAVIILSGLTFAYADDPEEALPPSSGASAYSVEEQSFIDQASDDTDRDLRTLSVEVVRAAASTYSVDDIYNLLISVYTTYTGRASWAVFDQTISDKITNDFSHYDSTSGNTYDTGAMLWLIRNILNNIQSQLVPAASSYLPSIYELIDNINTAISDYLSDIRYGLIDSNNTPYLVNIYNKLLDIESGSIDYTSALFYNSVGVAEYASRINSAIVASYNGLHTKLGVLDSIDSKLSTTNSTLNIKLTSLNTHAQTIEDKIDNQTTTISSDLSSSGAIASGITQFNNDFNNISWVNSDAVFTYEYTNGSLIDGFTRINPGSYYLYFNTNTTGLYNTILDILIPFAPQYDNTFANSDLKFEFGYLVNNNFIAQNEFIPYYFYLNKEQYSFHLIVSPLYRPNWNCIKMTSNVALGNYINLNTNFGNHFLRYISSDKEDYYTVYQNILLHYQSDVLKTFKELYASDDLIAAKENQQQYEDQVIDDFTGSGSAAAKASDAASAKDISSAVSSGLNSGGSVNNSLSVFNPSGGFWGWFSQENSDYINNLSSQTRLRSSGSGSDWVIDDPYQRNAEELQSILGGDR